MTLAEIEDIIVMSQAAGLSDVEYQTEAGFLRIRLAASPGLEREAPPESEPGPGSAFVSVPAPCPGIFITRHPMTVSAESSGKTIVAKGETVGFVKIGPCLRAVEAPRAGHIAKQRTAENTLVGYGEVLFDIVTEQ